MSERWNGTLEAGLFVRGELRRWLQQKKWHGEVQEWTELKRLLGSDFLVRGMTADALRQFAAVAHDMEWKTRRS